MKLEKLHLVNIKKHNDLVVDFKNGSTMILGKNGTGKSTIVESIFYLFFRDLVVSNVNEMISEDVIDSTGDTIKYKDKSYVEGWFEHGGKKYHLISGLAKVNCSLEEYDSINDKWTEKSNKIKDIYLYIQNDILGGMTSEYFKNTIYTEQMGILNLVGQTEGVRQKEFDKLINIDNFQTIYDAMGKPSSELNKMVRNDVNDLNETLKIKNEKINSLKFEVNEVSKDIEERISHKESISKGIDFELEKEKCLKMKYDSMLLDYNEMLQCGHKIKISNDAIKDQETEELRLRSQYDYTKMESDINNLENTLKEEYNKIVFECTLTNNFYKLKIQDLEEQYKKYQSDINTHEILNLYKKSLSDIENNLKNHQSVLNENASKVEPKKKLIWDLEETIKTLKNEEATLVKEVTTKSVEQSVLIKMYYNDNYDSHKIIEYFNNDITIDFNETMTCSYCQSKLSKDQIIDKLTKDKEKYTHINNEISDLDEKLLSVRESIALNQDTVNQEKQQLSILMTNVQYAENMIKDLAKRTHDIKIDMSVSQNKLHSSNAYHELIQITKKIENDLNEIKENQNIRLLQTHSMANTTDSKDCNPIELVVKINVYNNNLKSFEDMKHAYTYNINKLNNIKDNIRHNQNCLITAKENLTQLLSKYNENKIISIYDAIQNLHNELGDLRLLISTRENDIRHVDEMIRTKKDNLSKITTDITCINNEIENIKSVITKNNKVIKKIEMLNVAKSYFKQDGLAKYIRQFYINKINQNIVNYVDLFNFDFIPRIDETAGIEKYYKYSGGQKIAIAILMKIILNFVLKNPMKMMILDEPTPYMDSERIEAIRDLVDKIKDVLQVIVITHDTEFMNIECNKVLL